MFGDEMHKIIAIGGFRKGIYCGTKLIRVSV